MVETLATKIKFRQDTAANWSTNNPILALGEPAIEVDTNYLKIGDGTSTWNNLPYQTTPSNTISEVPADGLNYVRTREVGAANGNWLELPDNSNASDSRKRIVDLLQTAYNTELNMNYTILNSSGSNVAVYGIRKNYSINASANVANNQVIQSGVASIIGFGGTFQYDSTHTAILPTYASNWNANVVLDNEDDTVMLETVSSVNRVNSLADVWILYTKI